VAVAVDDAGALPVVDVFPDEQAVLVEVLPVVFIVWAMPTAVPTVPVCVGGLGRVRPVRRPYPVRAGADLAVVQLLSVSLFAAAVPAVAMSVQLAVNSTFQCDEMVNVPAVQMSAPLCDFGTVAGCDGVSWEVVVAPAGCVVARAALAAEFGVAPANVSNSEKLADLVKQRSLMVCHAHVVVPGVWCLLCAVRWVVEALSLPLPSALASKLVALCCALMPVIIWHGLLAVLLVQLAVAP